VGGHSVDDPELKFGLSVTGTVHPKQVITNIGAKPGDVLILTKPLGTGILNTAIKANMASTAQISEVTEQMATLNKNAAELMLQHEVHACTDVTGFGLLGHACEMIQDTSVGIRISGSAVPLLEGVINAAQTGLIPGGTYRNRDFSSPAAPTATAISARKWSISPPKYPTGPPSSSSTPKPLEGY